MKKDILSILSNRDTKFLFQIFRHSGYEIRYVGGCVRDALLRKKSDDIDFSTNARPEKMQEIFRKNNVHYFNSGLKHGTITAVFNKTCYEITTLRYDTNHTGRHATVEYTDNWELDAERRDFTFNALYCDESGKIYDYFNGIEDLKNRKLHFIGDCEQRIQEDYLRILRAFRFNNRYCDGNFSDEIIEAFKKFSDKIQNLSGERIQQEITKLISEVKIENLKMLDFINSTGISKYVFDRNEVDFSILERMIQFKIDETWQRLALLFRYSDVSSEWVKSRWNLSRVNYQLLKKVVEIDVPKDFFVMESKYFFLFYEIREIFLFCCFYEKLFNENDFLEISKRWSEREMLSMPIENKDVIDMGFQGRMIGEALNFAQKEWLESNCILSKGDLIKRVEGEFL